VRKIIAALITSLDGLIEGPNGELDWVDSWEDPFDLLPQIDTCVAIADQIDACVQELVSRPGDRIEHALCGRQLPWRYLDLVEVPLIG
jgi:hypothetical protein